MSYKLTIQFESPLHHGSGFGLSGLVDRAVLRDSYGIPYLAGSAIKGKLRHAALRVLLAEDQPACQTGDGKEWCGEHIGLQPAPCQLCRIFGSPRRQGDFFFEDAYPAGETRGLVEALANLTQDSGGLHRDSAIRTRVAMDRKLGTAREGLLFSTEVLPEFLVFKATIRTMKTATDSSQRELLRKACLVTTHLGADGARGLGRCSLSIKEAIKEAVGS